ncbi:hypothetical protein J0J30_23430, partial [Vibrio vulnificus]|nr:hypothetical protein [Vibrio vulnificus]
MKQMIRSMLPNYFDHLEKNKTSLLSTMYGLHAVKPGGGLKVWILYLV